MYAYEAQGDDELSVSVGELLELTALGDQYADGWYEGVDRKGRKVSCLHFGGYHDV